MDKTIEKTSDIEAFEDDIIELGVASVEVKGATIGGFDGVENLKGEAGLIED